MWAKNRGQVAGMVGMAAAALFFIGLLIEYRYGLFPPSSGGLFVANQLMFYVAMAGIVVLLWGIRQGGVGGNGRFAHIVLTLFPLGWVMLIIGGLVMLLTGNGDNLLFPLGGLSNMVFGLLAGIVVARNKQWHGWPRFALLLQGVYFLLVMMILPPILTGSNEPTLLTESLWMATWFLVGLACWQMAKASSEG